MVKLRLGLSIWRLRNTAHKLYLDDDEIQFPELQDKDLSQYYLRLVRQRSGVHTFSASSYNYIYFFLLFPGEIS